MAVDTSPAFESLRRLAAISALLTLVQAALAIGFLRGVEWMGPVHGAIGYLILVLSLFIARLGVSWATGDRARRRTMWHAASLPALAGIQIGLATSQLKDIHMVMGIVFFVAAFTLFSRSGRALG